MEGRRPLPVATTAMPFSAATRERIGEEAMSWSCTRATGLTGRDEEKEVLTASELPTTLRLARRSMLAMEGARAELVAETDEMVRTRPPRSMAGSSMERKVCAGAVKEEELWSEGERGYCSAAADRAASLAT